jgi:DNA repair photolyase
MNERLARAIEPRVPPPTKRLLVLEMAKAHGITTGAIVAPVLPPISFRNDVKNDMRSIADALAKTEVDLVYGESLHLRGGNISSVEEAIREPILTPEGFDEFVASAFRSEMARVGLRATWWLERGHRGRIRAHRNGEPDVLSIINDHPSSGGFGIWQDKPRAAGIGSKGTSGN